jgi:hypothetical protein
MTAILLLQIGGFEFRFLRHIYRRQRSIRIQSIERHNPAHFGQFHPRTRITSMSKSDLKMTRQPCWWQLYVANSDVAPIETLKSNRGSFTAFRMTAHRVAECIGAWRIRVA